MSDNNLFPLKEEQSVHSEAAEPVLNSPTARGTSDLQKLDFVTSTEGSLQRPIESFELEEVLSLQLYPLYVLTHCSFSNVDGCFPDPEF